MGLRGMSNVQPRIRLCNVLRSRVVSDERKTHAEIRHALFSPVQKKAMIVTMDV